MQGCRNGFTTQTTSYNKCVPDAYILGIESSCDETAAAVVRSGEELISNVVYSQIATHYPYGGVVPELASREHLRAIVPVVRKALEDASKTYQTIDAIAVTQGPGLAGSLLVGLSYAKGLAFALDKPLIAVNHLEGHIHAVLLEERQNGKNELQFPVLALVVSGGHTHLYLAERRDAGWIYRNIGHTRDDAAGEAFDKVAKLLELGYPGGPVIDFLAQHGNPQAVKFPFAQIKHRDRNPQNRHAEDERRTDFSYSGIKTAVLRYVEVHDMGESIRRRRESMKTIAKPSPHDYLAACDRQTLDLVASFQRAVVDDLVSKTLAAAIDHVVATLLVTGGVAANRELRKTFETRAAEEGIPVLFPSRKLSTDNAAMIAAAAYPRFLAHEFAHPELSSDPALRLG
ncbi:MAG TPA: tRNA (adenosine(37)-N6)-threonylcarbamoyltransferase complex transferase subunit TsaD [Candidatus Eisenbacteria bacterium]|nr:tRNA (adenosine(37)-N6)-threonylcarbamoyltransferase complex transferase subunit TsaD [Candidatus Eisenbacteria bacterium]